MILFYSHNEEIEIMVRNTGRYFPALRIKEEKMTNEEIFHTFNYAFVAVELVEKKGKGRIIHFDPDNEQQLVEWDEFYESLDIEGTLYVDKTPREEGDFNGYRILFSVEPLPNCWAVCYARKTSPRIITTPAIRHVKHVKKTPVKQCTCACTCGARLGISI